MDYEPNQFIIGLRYDRQFKFWSSIGMITDKLLALQGTNDFPKHCFDNIEQPNGNTVFLTDKSNVFRLECSIDQIVLTVNYKKSSVKHGKLKRMFFDIANVIMPLTTKDDNIARLGMVHVFEFDDMKYITKQLDDALLSVNHPPNYDLSDIALRYNYKKRKLEEWLDKKFIKLLNTIVQLQSGHKGDVIDTDASILKFSVDHQMYFKKGVRLRKEMLDNLYVLLKQEINYLVDNNFNFLNMDDHVEKTA